MINFVVILSIKVMVRVVVRIVVKVVVRMVGVLIMNVRQTDK